LRPQLGNLVRRPQPVAASRAMQRLQTPAARERPLDPPTVQGPPSRRDAEAQAIPTVLQGRRLNGSGGRVRRFERSSILRRQAQEKKAASRRTRCRSATRARAPSTSRSAPENNADPKIENGGASQPRRRPGSPHMFAVAHDIDRRLTEKTSAKNFSVRTLSRSS